MTLPSLTAASDCIAACVAECRRHEHAHCQLCAQACEACEQACRALAA